MTTISDDKLNNKMTDLANAIRTKFNKTNKMSVRDMIQTLALPSYRPSIYVSDYGKSMSLGDNCTINSSRTDIQGYWAINNDECINYYSDNLDYSHYFNSSYLSYPASYKLNVNYDFMVTTMMPLSTINNSTSDPIPAYTGGNANGDYAWVDSITARNGIGHIRGWHCAGGASSTAKYHWIILVVNGQEVTRFTAPMWDSNDVYNVHKDIKTSNHCRFDIDFPITNPQFYAGKVEVVMRYSDNYGDTGERGPQGIQGVKGDTGPAGPAGADGKTPVRGTDYWTETDQNTIKQWVEDAILNGKW